MRFLLLIAIGCFACAQLQAATVFKCKDSAGHITFVQDACPDAGVGEAISVQNARPSGTGADVRLAPPMPKYVAPRAARYVAPPPVEEPVEVAEERDTTTPSRGGTVPRKPRVVMVDQRYSHSKKMPDGSTRGTAGIRKVPVLAR